MDSKTKGRQHYKTPTKILSFGHILRQLCIYAYGEKKVNEEK